MRFMGLLKADEHSEAGEFPNDPTIFQRMAVFMQEVAEAGVLIATDGLAPSSKGKRIKLENGNITVTDGPFTESKELVASYALFNVKSMDEAVHWTKRFLEVLGRGECELRPIFEPSDFPADIFPPEMAAAEEEMRKTLEQNAKK